MLDIAVDMDNVLTDFSKHAVQLLKEGYDFEFKPEDQWDTWNMSDWSTNVTPEYFETTLKNLMNNREGFWKFMSPIEGAYEGLEYLNNKHNVFILTTPQWTSKYCVTEKIEWLNCFMPFINTNEQVIMTHAKDKIKADVMVDDKPEHILNFYLNDPDHISIIFDYPFNRMIGEKSNLHRAYSWKNIMELL